MSRFSKNISGWFGYSRRERRASLMILIIILLVIVFRFTAPEKSTDVKVTTPLQPEVRHQVLKSEPENHDTSGLFYFDPNSASQQDLAMLGLNERQIKTLVRYREKGARFRTPGDISKVYGIDFIMSQKLIPYININEAPGKLKKTLLNDSTRQHLFKGTSRIKTELNSADSADLDRLPGIGPVLSSRIIRYRDLLGGFYSVYQLKEVYGISDSLFNLISGRVLADSSEIIPIDINKATFKDLIKNPYLKRYEVTAILKFRQLKGRIDSVSELAGNKILDRRKSETLRHYFSAN